MPQTPMQRAAERAEHRPYFLAHAVARYRAAHALTNEQVAAALGIDAEALAPLMCCANPRQGGDIAYALDLTVIAEHSGADRGVLAEICES